MTTIKKGDYQVIDNVMWIVEDVKRIKVDNHYEDLIKWERVPNWNIDIRFEGSKIIAVYYVYGATGGFKERYEQKIKMTREEILKALNIDIDKCKL